MSERPVTTDALETLGHIIDVMQKRDAIHIAVEPVVAQLPLKPGDHVGADGTKNNPVGIVDPFLTTPVRKGERFWLLIYPRKINSLRHVWSHPAFLDEINDNATEQIKARVKSEIWLRKFIEKSDCPEFKTLLDVISGKEVFDEEGVTYSLTEEYFHFNGADAHGEIPHEFWDHMERVTGKPMTKRPTMFSCSC